MSRFTGLAALVAAVAFAGSASAADYRSPLFPSTVAPARVAQAPGYQVPTVRFPAYHPTHVPVLPLPAPAASTFATFDHHEGHAHAGESKAIELFSHVKVRDPDHIACCAETKIIKVPDPCWKADKCGCCKPKRPCVYIAICVPKETKCHHHEQKPCCTPKPTCAAPLFHHHGHGLCGCAPKPKLCNKCHKCGCEHKRLKITCLLDGKYQKYDYGKYRVEVRVKDGYVEVDYDD